MNRQLLKCVSKFRGVKRNVPLEESKRTTENGLWTMKKVKGGTEKEI